LSDWFSTDFNISWGVGKRVSSIRLLHRMLAWSANSVRQSLRLAKYIQSAGGRAQKAAATREQISEHKENSALPVPDKNQLPS